MKYEEFVDAIIERLEVAPGVTVEKHISIKNNGTKRLGILIRKDPYGLAPVVYPENFYDMAQRGEPLSHIAKLILDTFTNLNPDTVIPIDELLVFDSVKDHIIYELINKEQNEKMLSDVPYIEFHDLAVCFYVLIRMMDHGLMTLQIKNEFLKMWGIDKKELYRLAEKNTSRLLPAEFFDMSELLGLDRTEFFAEDHEYPDKSFLPEFDMYVLTNEQQNRGASVILYPHILEMVSERLGGDFYILPSSIHEVIVLRGSEKMSRDYLTEMVRDVNSKAVADEDILSDHMYFFEKESGRLLY